MAINYGSTGNNVENLVKGFGKLPAAGVGAAVGSAAGPVGMILGSVAGSVIGGIFDAVQGGLNRSEYARQQAEARAIAERQFAWGQDMDRFNMGMMNRQQDEAEKMNQHKITQDRVDRLNSMLKTNVELQNYVRSLWGRK
jgi:hypothetical protein